ncbi:hypothetical protein HaLaN_19554 [Haematococcus lacustris]|uniref:Uncharacterized protein n=1 Tax=Haematococcus lacustris TaxID=44745 RepID=A0A699ZHF0_HAELA|nr:hypothetical protein HaLaN_19554 [Haematococcus lacustris]
MSALSNGFFCVNLLPFQPKHSRAYSFNRCTFKVMWELAMCGARACRSFKHSTSSFLSLASVTRPNMGMLLRPVGIRVRLSTLLNFLILQHQTPPPLHAPPSAAVDPGSAAAGHPSAAADPGLAAARHPAAAAGLQRAGVGHPAAAAGPWSAVAERPGQGSCVGAYGPNMWQQLQS